MPSLSSTPLLALRWPFGIVLTGWAYMWRTTPMRREEVAGALPDDLPPELPAGTDLAGVQRLADGAGPLFHRTYGVSVRGSKLAASELIDRVAADPDAVSPSEFASFQKRRGAPGDIRVGDEFVVRMPGPWNGPVRAVERTAAAFRFATLDGHLEAGQIEWRARDDAETVRFEVESWARPGDRLSMLVHHRLRMAKEVQLHMWTSVLERVVRLSGGRRAGPLEIHTRVASFSGEASAR